MYLLFSVLLSKLTDIVALTSIYSNDSLLLRLLYNIQSGACKVNNSSNAYNFTLNKVAIIHDFNTVVNRPGSGQMASLILVQ